MGPEDSLFVRGSVVKIGELHVNGAPYPIGGFQDRHGKSAVIAWTHTFTPSLLNEFRFGATYHRNHYTSDVNGSTLLQQFGITGIPAYTGSIGLNDPYFNITGVSDLESRRGFFLL